MKHYKEVNWIILKVYESMPKIFRKKHFLRTVRLKLMAKLPRYRTSPCPKDASIMEKLRELRERKVINYRVIHRGKSIYEKID